MSEDAEKEKSEGEPEKKPTFFADALMDIFGGPPKPPGPVVLPKPEEFTHVRDFDEALKDTDPFTIFLRGHLWIERALHESILANGIRRVDQYDNLKLGFVNTVYLASSLGVLHPSNIPAFKKLNSFRNRLAHDPRFKLDEDAIKDFVNAALPRLRKAYEGVMMDAYKKEGAIYDPTALITQFRNSLQVLHMIADMGRVKAEERKQEQAEERERRATANEELAKKLGYDDFKHMKREWTKKSTEDDATPS